jgi:hypothetical protein
MGAPDLINDPYDLMAAITLVLGGLMAMNVKPVWARFLVPTLLSGIITYAKLFPLVVSLVPSFMAPSWLNDHICQVASSVVAGFLIGWVFLSYAMPAIVGLVSWVLLSRLPGQSSTRRYMTQFLLSVFAVITGKYLPGVTDRLLGWVVNPLMASLYVAGATEYFHQEMFDQSAPRCITWRFWAISCSLEANRVFFTVLVGTFVAGVVVRLLQLKAIRALVNTPLNATAFAAAARNATPSAAAARPRRTPTPSSRREASPAPRRRRA